MTYSILNSERVEIQGTRTRDYNEALATWRTLYKQIICFLVVWDCPTVFRVLEPKS